MREIFKLKLVLLTIILLVIFCGTTFAKGPLYDTSTSTKISHKLLRGTLNVIFCFVEIPSCINDEVQNLDPFTGFFKGAYDGTCKAIVRGGCGVYEVITFPFPTRGQYESPIKPEFVLQDKLD